MSPPRDNIVRTLWPGPEFRASDDGDSIGVMSGHFAVFNQWTEIDSVREGNFLERIAPGAFTRTFAENRDSIRVLYDHGQDPHIGNKTLGVPRFLDEDREGAGYRVPLFDTSYNRDLLPGLQSKPPQYGASFRFSVDDEEFDRSAKKAAHNPKGLPERTIKAVNLYEFGPVTFPAYAGATAGVRSGTDDYLQRTRPTPQPSKESPAVSEYITREEKVSRVAELKSEIERLATEYPGELPGDVQSRWDAANTELDNEERAIAAWDSRQARVAALAGNEGNHDVPRNESGRAYPVPAVIVRKTEADIYDLNTIERSATSIEDRGQKYRDFALRSIETSRFPVRDQAAARAGIADFIEFSDSPDPEKGNSEAARRILLTGSPIYRRLFNKYLRDGNGMGFTPEEQRAAALAVTGTTTTGGYAVPYIFDPTFINIGVHTSINPYRAACRVETISGGNNWRGVTSSAITAKWDAEAAASVEGGPTLGQPSITAQRADAYATVSIETLQDRPDIGDELSRLFQEAKDNLEENSFTLGTGATVYPFGMFTTLAFTAVTTATDNVTAKADIYAMEAALPLRHRANAAWFMSRSTLRQFQAFETVYGELFGGVNYAAVGSPSNSSPVGNTGLKLIGYPVWEVPSAVSTLTTNASQIAVFGDPKNYVILDRVGLNVEVIQHVVTGLNPSFPTGQRGIYAYWRGTARPINVDGMRQLVVQ